MLVREIIENIRMHFKHLVVVIAVFKSVGSTEHYTTKDFVSMEDAIIVENLVYVNKEMMHIQLLLACIHGDDQKVKNLENLILIHLVIVYVYPPVLNKVRQEVFNLH